MPARVRGTREKRPIHSAERSLPAHHDQVVAIVSHLPHLITFTICGTADDLAD
jgi:prephenate dehydrogenase